MKHLVTVILIIISGRGLGQSLEGLVADSANAPVPYIAVGLLRATDSSIVKGTSTDEKGRFRFNGMRSGNYHLKISAPGYAGYFSPVISFDSLSDLELPVVRLKLNGKSLDEVTITTMKKPIEFRNGNITVNIEGSPLAIGNSIYDVLSRMPGVTVDNDNISIQGKDGVNVYLDGRLQPISGAQLTTLLRSMSSADVEKIEIIRNPSAKYDAAGSAGIIDIKTKKLRTIGASGNIGYTFSKGHASTNRANAALNYKGRKISLFSSVSGYEGTLLKEYQMYKTIDYAGETTSLDSRSTELDVANYAIINLGMDWFVDKKNTLGVRVQGVPGYAKRTKGGNNALSDGSLGYNNLIYKRTVPNYWFLGNYNLNFEHLFDTLGTKIKLSADLYSPYSDVYISDYQYRFTDNALHDVLPPKYAKGRNDLDLKIIAAKLDFEKKFSKTLNFEAGAKGSYQDILSNYNYQNQDAATGEFVTDSLYTNNYIYHEEITAAYMSIDKEIKKFSFRLGLRGENTVVKSSSRLKQYEYNRNYAKLFPGVSVNYNASDISQFSASYNRRIYRPNYNSFNPYYEFNNIFSISRGNPRLMPEFYHSIELSHTYKSKLSNSFSFARSQSPIRGQTQQDDSLKITYFQLGNLESSNEMRYFINYNGDIRKWWNLTLNLGGYWYDFKGVIDSHTLNKAAYSYSGYINNVILLPKHFKVELSGWYVGPWLYGGFYEIDPRGALNVAVKKSFLENKLNFAMGLYDIFFTGVNHNRVNFANQKLRILETYDSRRFNVSVNYSFGRIKVRPRDVNGNDEEAQRVGK